MNFLRNVQVVLQAKGLEAVLIIWVGSIAALGIFGNGELGYAALGILGGSLALLRFLLKDR